MPHGRRSCRDVDAARPRDPEKKHVRTKNHIAGSGAVFDLIFPGDLPRRPRKFQIGGSRASVSIESRASHQQLFAGLTIVAAVQAGTATVPYVVALRCG